MVDTLKANRRDRFKGVIYASGNKTLKEFGERIGYGPARISAIVNGKAFPSDMFQRKAAQALGLSIKELSKLL
ncbi:MAG: helix-turn-helix transcriptional regulator [Desulfobacteraceae bacterium]|uniref:Helix-turn-helix transcriptional regulator n=1 Tax=Candidatus Desulfacyla euxinica TaxID=2841693 RepID=A0A8J6T2W6_9DELT|nr:helix-turn-helix transcriptional regulator [Candidatus Desulfacyla euxinica]MBL6978005.1 helix-turn-helix transcriptional regulator [Desulfobacteraceae bacterium]